VNRVEATRQPQKLEYASSSPLTPTEYLLNALRNVGHKQDNVEFQDSGVRRSKKVLDEPIPPSIMRKRRPSRRCLQTILAEYIQFVEPFIVGSREPGVGINNDAESALDNELGKVFCDEHLGYLEARRYSVADVVAWAWILKCNTTYEAVLRILALEEGSGAKYGAGAPGIPPFIPLFLLRKQRRLEAKAFRLLLTYSLHLISGRAPPTLRHFASEGPDGVVYRAPQPENTKASIDPNMCVSFTESLLHHGRQVWPQAQFDIARAFAAYLTCPENEHSTAQNDRFKAENANKFLKLLSLPSNGSPFVSASIQQQAQFELLKAMAKQRPVLPVTRQGYRGIIAVQLAHKKTLDERQSAELKAPSWPPWKEEKLGIDAERGTEGMKSRAMQVINQMKHAGYSHSSWEGVAAVLAGWDTDNSPTIQTRGMMHRTETACLPEHASGESDYPAIWIARIRATRTVREAWACFLSYQDLNLPARRGVYTAMAEKLIYRGKVIKSDFDHVSLALPGDGPEVFSEPSSSRDVIYVDAEPPSLDEFLKQMLSQGIRPSGRLLALLLRSAATLGRGLDYLSCSDLSNCQIKALCTVRSEQAESDASDWQILNGIPESIFSAFIEFLCKFTGLNTYLARSDIHTADTFPVIMGARKTTQTTTLFAYVQGAGIEDMLDCPKILSHAIQLVRSRESRSPQPWIYLLSGLNKYRISVRHRMMSRGLQLVLAWHEVVEVVGWMNERGIELGLHGFQALCRSFVKAVSAAVNHPDDAERALEFVDAAVRHRNLVHCHHASRKSEDMVQNGLRILKGHFDQLVLLDPKILQSAGTTPDHKNTLDSQVTVPSMPSVPTPAVLHSFVRALGAAEDSDGLLSLLRWMGQSAPTLKECAEEFLGGKKMMRRTVVATRAFLERTGGRNTPGRSSVEHFTDDGREPVFPDPNLQEAYDIIEATPFLGPWPSDQEVWEYIHWEEG
jgi:hypothetical protein